MWEASVFGKINLTPFSFPFFLFAVNMPAPAHLNLESEPTFQGLELE